MYCQFDFFVVKAYSSSIRSLMQVGSFRREAIQSRLTYGGRWPQTTHHASIGYIDVAEIGHVEVRKRAEELRNMLPVVEGVRYSIEFYPVD
jgi:hypothetical protein